MLTIILTIIILTLALILATALHDKFDNGVTKSILGIAWFAFVAGVSFCITGLSNPQTDGDVAMGMFIYGILAAFVSFGIMAVTDEIARK